MVRASRDPESDDPVPLRTYPIAVEVAIAVIITPAAVAVIGNAEHALDRAHGAADTGADYTSDRPAHGTGDPVTFIGASWAPRTMPWA